MKDTHLFLPKAEISDLDSWRAALTLESDDQDKIILTYKETEKGFGIPLYHPRAIQIARSHPALVDNRSKGIPAKYTLTSSFRPEQLPVFAEFEQRIAEGRCGIILTARTGFGKTVMLLSFLAHLGRSALVVVPREYIAHQWRERILQHTSLTEDQIGLAQQNVCDYNRKAIVIGMIHSLAKDKYPKEFKRYFGAVVFDECHMMGAQEFSATASLYPSLYRIGASAKLERQDGMTNAYMWHMRQSIIDVGGKHKDRPRIFRIKLFGTKRVVPDYAFYIKDKLSRRGVIISALALASVRNKAILRFLESLLNTSRRVLLLSDRTQQLALLREALLRKGFAPDKIGVVTQRQSQARKKEVVDNCQLVLSTYPMFSMAADLSPDFSALVLATPIADATQSVGRIMREAPGKKMPVVFDLIDMELNDCLRWATARNALWKSMDADIKVVDARGKVLEGDYARIDNRRSKPSLSAKGK